MSVEHKRGETLRFALMVTEGTVTGSETVSAVLKRAVRGVFPPGDAADPALTFTPTYIAPSGGDVARWDISADAAATAALEVGMYVTDVKFIYGGVTYVSPTVQVNVVERVTE